MNNFKGFSELGGYRDKLAKKEEDKKTASERARQEKFNSLLGDNFEEFLSGNFSTDVGNINSITIIKSPADKETGEINALYVTPFYGKKGKERHTTLTLNKEGRFIGNIPKEMGVSREDLYEEVLRIAESINPSFFESVDDDILPPGEWCETDQAEPKESKEGGTVMAIDPRRLEFIRKQPHVLFGFAGINSGFRGYYGFVFPNFIMLENNKVGNAAYFFDLSEPIEFDEKIFEKPPEQRLDREARKSILDEHWRPVSNLTKKQALEKGAERKTHPVVADDDWEGKMSDEINRRIMSIQNQ